MRMHCVSLKGCNMFFNLFFYLKKEEKFSILDENVIFVMPYNKGKVFLKCSITFFTESLMLLRNFLP